ncbi:MAG: endopeptidase La [Flavobacteriales bacterium]
MTYHLIGEDTDFIPLMTTEEEGHLEVSEIPEELPILPLRNTVLFPGVVIPITVGRDKSIKLIRDAYKGKRIIGVVAQRDAEVEEPGMMDLFEIGTVASILKMLRMPDGSTTAIIQGKRRCQIEEMLKEEPYLMAKASIFEEGKPEDTDSEFNAMVSSIKDLALEIIQASPNLPSEAAFAIRNIESPSFLIHFISSNLSNSMEEKQAMLEVKDLKERATVLLQALHKESQLLELKNQIQSKVRVDMDKQQREYFLHQQMRQIQEELGNGETVDIKDLRKKAARMKWGKSVQKAFDKEVAKLERMNSMAPDYSIQLNYLEFMTDLPWSEYSKDQFDLKRARKILDRDHFGLEKVKERIIEHLAVLKLRGDMRAPILCLAGPPGVGKTSLGRSVAEALGRKYTRMSLGGLRDESEIRGHRKTYIGAMPGRILQSLKKSGTSNPVFILDEIDKLSRDVHGDPSSAMLEVLDPEQNNSFHDNFLDLDFDLSKVLFIATANNLSSIQPALRDRMEIIHISGYSVEEKVEIAKKHLLPRQLKEHGLGKDAVQLSKPILEFLIESYTRESGVRNLERKIAAVVRKAAVAEASYEFFMSKIGKSDLVKILGPALPKEQYENNEQAGVVVGLAYTAVGGDILFIETSLSRGKGRLTLTGNLGGVMKESAHIALEYLKSKSDRLGLSHEVFDHWNVHLHVPEGATPKDGPSAGITMLTALASAFTQQKVRPKLAMTGEITLRGQVLPVGGIKEKVLAARRANIETIVMCEDNRRDVEEIEPSYLKGLHFEYVRSMDQVLDFALLKTKVKNAISVAEAVPTSVSRSKD